MARHSTYSQEKFVLRRLFVTIAVLLLYPFAAGAAAPDLALKDLAGKTHPVSEYIGKGQWTVVVVWSSDCPICKRDIHHMTFFHDEHQAKDARVLGLSIDGFENRAKAQAFVDDHDLNFPNLIGDPDDASRLSGQMFIGTPTYYFFAPDGRFASMRVGPVNQAQAEEVIRAISAKLGKR